MQRYLYVVDFEGREIRGSRRSLDHVETIQDYAAAERELRRLIGEDCEIRDSAFDGQRGTGLFPT